MQCLCDSFIWVVKVGLEETWEDQTGATATLPANQLTEERCRSQPLPDSHHIRGLCRKWSCVGRGASMQSKCQCRQKRASTWEKEKERHLGSLRLKKESWYKPVLCKNTWSCEPRSCLWCFTPTVFREMGLSMCVLHIKGITSLVPPSDANTHYEVWLTVRLKKR